MAPPNPYWTSSALAAAQAQSQSQSPLHPDVKPTKSTDASPAAQSDKPRSAQPASWLDIVASKSPSFPRRFPSFHQPTVTLPPPGMQPGKLSKAPENRASQSQSIQSTAREGKLLGRLEPCIQCVVSGLQCDGKDRCGSCSLHSIVSWTCTKVSDHEDWVMCTFCKMSGLSELGLCQHMIECPSAPDRSWKVAPKNMLPYPTRFWYCVTCDQDTFSHPLLAAAHVYSHLRPELYFRISSLQYYLRQEKLNSHPVVTIPHTRNFGDERRKITALMGGFTGTVLGQPQHIGWYENIRRESPVPLEIPKSSHQESALTETQAQPLDPEIRTTVDLNSQRTTVEKPLLPSFGSQLHNQTKDHSNRHNFDGRRDMEVGAAALRLLHYAQEQLKPPSGSRILTASDDPPENALHATVRNEKLGLEEDSVKEKGKGRATSGESHVCPHTDCGKSTKSAAGLKKHLQRHEKPFGCTFDNCHESFGSINDWKRHESSQHEQQECWLCHICREVFRDSRSFVDHMEQAHLLSDSERWVAERRISGRHQGRFWCGFCDSILVFSQMDLEALNDEDDRTAKHVMLGQLNYRSGHIARHFTYEKRSATDWIALTGRGKTKGQLLSQEHIYDHLPIAKNDPEPAAVSALAHESKNYAQREPILHPIPAESASTQDQHSGWSAGPGDTMRVPGQTEIPSQQNASPHLWTEEAEQDQPLGGSIGKLFELEIVAYLKNQKIRGDDQSLHLYPQDIFHLFRWMLWSCDFTSRAWQDIGKKMKDEFDPKQTILKLDHPEDIVEMKDELDTKDHKLGCSDAQSLALNQTEEKLKEDVLKDVRMKMEVDLDEPIGRIPDYVSGMCEPRSSEGSPVGSQSSYMESSGEESFIADEGCFPDADAETREQLEALVSELGPELAAEFLSSLQGRTTCTQGTSHDSPGTSIAGRWSHAEAGSSTAPTTATKLSSRKGRPRDDEDEEDDRRRKRPRVPNPDPDEADADGLLACPYAKYDPNRYSEANQNQSEKAYRRCRTAYLTSIPRVKQHLYRLHRRPEYYCSSCYMAFATENECDVHSRSRLCVLRDCPFDEKMTSDQCKAVRRRKMGETSVNAWFGIFDVLFPGTERPDNPYFEYANMQAAAQSVQDYSTFLESRLPPRLAERLGGPLFNTDPQMFEWLINMALEETLPIVLRELLGEYQAARPMENDGVDIV